MQDLIALVDTDGDTVWINPAHVMTVRAEHNYATSNRSLATVTLSNGTVLTLKSLEDVLAALTTVEVGEP